MTESKKDGKDKKEKGTQGLEQKELPSHLATGGRIMVEWFIIAYTLPGLIFVFVIMGWDNFMAMKSDAPVPGEQALSYLYVFLVANAVMFPRLTIMALRREPLLKKESRVLLLGLPLIFFASHTGFHSQHIYGMFQGEAGTQETVLLFLVSLPFLMTVSLYFLNPSEEAKARAREERPEG